MRLPSLSEHTLLILWVQIVVVVVVARVLGALMRRIGQPPVVGELLAGVLLGPSILAKIWPGSAHWLIPQSPTSAAPLNTLGWIGVAFLLILTGFETDLRIVRQLGRPATLVAIGGLLVPFAVGLGLGIAMPHSLHGSKGTTAAFVLFIAVSLSISSLPVIAKILDELGFLRRNFGQVTIAVGMVNDLVGWLALGIIAALGRSSHLSASTVAFPLIGIALLLGIGFTGGQRAVDWLLRHVRRRDASNVEAMTVVLAVAFIFAAVAQAIRSDAVLGAYIAGIIIGRSRFFQERVRHHLESVTMAVFAPIFFATAGLRIDLSSLGDGTALGWAGIILLAAVGTKLGGAFVAGRLAQLSPRESLALAIGLNARGAVEVVIATVGLTLGVLNAATYTAIVLMAIVTSVMAPPLLRLVVRDWRGEPEEEQRLAREETLARNLLVRGGRLLLPTRGNPPSLAAAEVLNAAWPDDADVTVLALGRDPDDERILTVRDAFGEREVEVSESTGNALEVILEEAKLGYVAVGLGANDDAEPGAFLGPVVDDLLGQCPIPMVIVRRGRQDTPCRQVLVPVAGSPASRTAQELAYALAQHNHARVHLAHVVDRPGGDAQLAMAAATGVIEQAADHAAEHDVEARASLLTAPSAGEEILAEANRWHADVIVLGTTVRRLGERAFLGYTVEHVLQTADATVVVVATPDAIVAEGVAGRDT